MKCFGAIGAGGVVSIHH